MTKTTITFRRDTDSRQGSHFITVNKVVCGRVTTASPYHDGPAYWWIRFGGVHINTASKQAANVEAAKSEVREWIADMISKTPTSKDSP